jgi:hypothetical protein
LCLYNKNNNVLFALRVSGFLLTVLSKKNKDHKKYSFLSFRPIPIFCLLVPTSKSRHHFSFSCTLSPLWSYLCHTPLILLLYLDSFFLACLCLVPFTQLYIHPFSFCSQFFHFFTGIPVSLVVILFLSLAFLLLRVLFLFSPAFR